MHSLPGACCLEREDAQERRPARIGDALGKVVILDHVGDPQVLVIDDIAFAHKRQRRLMVKVLSLAAHSLMRLGGALADAPWRRTR